MFNKEALPGANLRKELIQMEVLELSALIGAGGFALWQGELLPTVMAVGTLAGLAAWHTLHFLKERKSTKVTSSLQTGFAEETPLEIVESFVNEPPPYNDTESVALTLQAIKDGDREPLYSGPRLSSRIKERRRHRRKNR